MRQTFVELHWYGVEYHRETIVKRSRCCGAWRVAGSRRGWQLPEAEAVWQRAQQHPAACHTGPNWPRAHCTTTHVAASRLGAATAAPGSDFSPDAAGSAPDRSGQLLRTSARAIGYR